MEQWQLEKEIERFLYREAELLDERKFEEWLALFTEDSRYWMPMLSTRERGAKELTGEKELAFFDDNKRLLSLRVKRLYTEYAFAEDPPSRTTRLITNIRVEKGETDSEVIARSNFIVYKSRLETENEIYAGKREDRLRKVEGEWKIAMRKMVLTQNVLIGKNLSIFF